MPPLEVNTRLCRNLPLSSSATQSDVYCDQRGAPCNTEPFHDLCYQRPDASKRPLTFHPIAASDGINVETLLEKRVGPQKHSGGTWPKVMAGAVVAPEVAPSLSIFKTPKKRKSIFEADIFKRPETPSKLEYVTLAHVPKHAASRPEGALPSPPEPPKRSDSFKFKHKQQGSSASDSTLTTGTPPATPGGKAELGVDGFLLQRQNSGDAGTPTPRKSCDDEVMRHAADELEVRKVKSNSLSAPRRALTPLQIPILLQVTAYRTLDSLIPLQVTLCRFTYHTVHIPTTHCGSSYHYILHTAYHTVSTTQCLPHTLFTTQCILYTRSSYHIVCYHTLQMFIPLKFTHWDFLKPIQVVYCPPHTVYYIPHTAGPPTGSGQASLTVYYIPHTAPYSPGTAYPTL